MAFIACFDASGHPDSPGNTALVVAGFVSSVKKWEQFVGTWNRLLREHGVVPPFHMSEFAPAVGQYASWKEDIGRRKEFMAAAIKLMQSRTYRSFSTGIVLRDHRRILSEYAVPDFMRYPYVICAYHTMYLVAEWMERRQRHHKSVEEIAIIFEQGDKHKGKLIEMIETYGPEKVYPNFRSKAEYDPLQLADILAWEHARRINDDLGRKGRPPRGSLAEIGRHVPAGDSYYINDYETLVQTCEKRGICRVAAL